LLSLTSISGLQLYLSKEGLGAEIVTSKSSEMNVLVPVDGQEDPVEMAIPEQYKTWVREGPKLFTETVQHSG
jgi:adenylyl cyclase-associated protein